MSRNFRGLRTVCVITCPVLAVSTACSPTGAPTGSDGMVLPTGLALNISEFPDDNVDPDQASTSSARPFDSANERSCATGGAMVHGFHRLLDRGLAVAASVNADMSSLRGPRRTGLLSVPSRGGVTYYADFTAFDFNGDGQLDGTGRADVAPVALRLWVMRDGEPRRFLCALITRLPNESNSGAGELYMHPGTVHPQVASDFRIRVAWDHTNEAYRWNQAYTVGALRGNLTVDAGHHLVEHTLLEDGAVQKTVRSTAMVNRSDFDVTEVRYSGRTLAGSGVAVINASGSGSVALSVSGVCIALPGCAAVDAQQCAGIHIADLVFLAPPTGTETDWPADFPEEPTF